MSAVLFYDDVLFFQRLLKSEGFYAGELDGLWGPLTEKGSNEFDRLSLEIKDNMGGFDSRTEKNILTLALDAQREARIFMGKVLDSGIRTKIISGTRTYEEQNRLFRIGRYGNPGTRVTNARGGQSYHNFCIAWDIGVFTENGGYITSKRVYNEAADASLSDKIFWGGNWTSFVDRPHYNLNLNLSLSEIREKFEKGEKFIFSE